MFTLDRAPVKVTLVDVYLVAEAGDIGDIDLDGAVTQGFHILIGQQLAIFRLVGVADDHLVDIGLGEFLRLDLVLLRGGQQIVEEGHIKLKQLNKFDHTTVGDVQLAVKVKGPWVGI